MNEHSSRSHAIFIITIECSEVIAVQFSLDTVLQLTVIFMNYNLLTWKKGSRE